MDLLAHCYAVLHEGVVDVSEYEVSSAAVDDHTEKLKELLGVEDESEVMELALRMEPSIYGSAIASGALPFGTRLIVERAMLMAIAFQSMMFGIQAHKNYIEDIDR